MKVLKLKDKGRIKKFPYQELLYQKSIHLHSDLENEDIKITVAVVAQKSNLFVIEQISRDFCPYYIVKQLKI